MKRDIVFAGVGGQGVLSIATIIAAASLDEGLEVKQGEVHGMAQRGGAVQATLRIADGPIHSDLVPHGEADLVVALEPLESLRYLEYLAPTGVLLTSQEPIRNFPNYPDLERVFARIRSLPRAVLVDTKALARQAGSPLTSNVVMVGAASAFLPLQPQTLEAWIRKIFGKKGDRIVQANLKAFQSGRESVPCEVA